METQEYEFVTIVEAVKAGDNTAFDQLVPILRPVVRSAVFRMFGGSWTGISQDDLTQEAWIACYQALFSYDTERYPTLVRSYFRSAIISRLISVIDDAYILGIPRPLKRFIKDVRCGVVEWELNDAGLKHLYPLVEVEDIKKTRCYGAAMWNAQGGGCIEFPTSQENHRRTGEALDETVATRLDAEALVITFMSQLDEVERDVFRLRFLEERSRAVVCRTLGWSVARMVQIEASILAKRVGLVTMPTSC